MITTQPTDIVKVTTNLPKRLIDDLAAGALERGQTLTRALGTAIATKNFLTREIRAGGTLLLEYPDGTTCGVLLP